jgi:fatty-acyl-CoA synthase
MGGASQNHSSLRLADNGGEPVDPVALERFSSLNVRHGFDPRAMYCAFGMAEATLGVAFPEPMTGVSIDTVDKTVLASRGYAEPATSSPSARALVSLGRPLSGIDLRIVDEAGSTCWDRQVGDVHIRGVSVAHGYVRNAAATAEAFADGWFQSGDLG